MDVLRERYGNLFELYQHITGDDPLRGAMRIAPAAHYTMGGLWVDYDLMSNLPGLFVIGEANFSDHGANRLGASALMQGLADGYFILPYTLAGYLAGAPLAAVDADGPEARGALAQVGARLERLLAIGGRRTAGDFHRALGGLLWNHCGLERSREGLEKAIDEVAALREAFWKDLALPGGATELNQELERAGRVADFLELGELMCRDALAREESCGCHFRMEHQTSDGEALRDDARFAHVAAWMPGEQGRGPERLPERLSNRSISPRWPCTSARTSEAAMNVTLRIWRQRNPREAGGFLRYTLGDVRPEMTLLEVLDRLNEELAAAGEPPVAFDSDCREGICGACGIVVDGRPHGPPARHDHLPAPDACVPRRRHHHAGALSHRRLPPRARPRRGPARAGPGHAGGRLYLRARRQRSRGQYDPGGSRVHRARPGRRRVHRVWRLRGRLSQWLRLAVRGRQAHPPGALAARPAGARAARTIHGGRRGR
jgi:hypothetical protein